MENKQASILLVDDDVEVLKAITKVLERDGYVVTPRSSGTEALESLRQENSRFRLIITDVSMPGMRGTTLLSALQTAYPEIPVIVVTGFGDWGQYMQVMRGGATEYLSKPLDKSELLDVVHRVLAAHGANPQEAGV